jgi:hypothetical protein
MANGEIHLELSVNYADDPKVAALARWPKDTRAARDLYVQMALYAKRNLTDGFVPAEQVGVLCYPDPPKTGVRQAGLLVQVGLVTATDDGYVVAAFLKRNRSRAEVEALSATRAQSGRTGGTRSGVVRKREASTKQVGKQTAKHVASVGLNTETETETETKQQDCRPAADGSASAPAEPLSVTQRSKVITDAYSEAEPLSKWPAVNGIVIKAIQAAKWTDPEIRAALLRLAAEGRAVTIETLRTELAGQPPRRNGRTPTSTERLAGAPDLVAGLRALEAR